MFEDKRYSEEVDLTICWLYLLLEIHISQEIYFLISNLFYNYNFYNYRVKIDAISEENSRAGWLLYSDRLRWWRWQ